MTKHFCDICGKEIKNTDKLYNINMTVGSHVLADKIDTTIKYEYELCTVCFKTLMQTLQND